MKGKRVLSSLTQALSSVLQILPFLQQERCSEVPNVSLF